MQEMTSLNQSSKNPVIVKGEEILKRMEGQSKGSIFSKDFWYGSIMDWSMKNESFKVNMFRFVDVLPSLGSSTDVAKHLKEYFAENGDELPSVFNMGLGLGSLAPGLMAGAIRKNVTQMAKMFIAGETPDECLSVLKKARKNKMTFTVDILGEATLSEKEAQEYLTKYIELIDGLAKDSSDWDTIPQIDQDDMGAIPKVNVSVKMSALFSQINDKSWDDSKEILKSRLRTLFKLGKEKNIFINLDMEHYGIKHLTVEVYKELLMEPEFRDYPHFGCVVQAYLRDSFEDIQGYVRFAKERKTPFTIRLVKGAYWDSETIESQQKQWLCPVYTNKAETDANYEVCARYLLENYKFIRVAIASHNVRSISAALVAAENLSVPPNGFEIQMLYGMADPIKKSLIDMGYRVREYAPMGDLLPGMAYLVRRLLENTSNESWLRGKFAENKSSLDLLKDPAIGLIKTTADVPKNPKFENEALLDFAVEENRIKTQNAINKISSELPIEVPVLIGSISGQASSQSSTTQTTQKGESVYTRVNPSQTSKAIAKVQMASVNQAESAIQAAHVAYKTWKNTSAESRAKLLNKLADLMLENRFDLMATQILEVGKPWAEADGDITEAIDFCRYYANHLEEISKPQRVGHAPGETSFYHYKPRGVTLVIAPWNFPLAIIAGMTAAALVTGNTVVMKPAEQSSLMAWKLMQLIQKAGFPNNVVQFLPGYGEKVGEYLVSHKLTSTIAFTGSKQVGLHILKQAQNLQPGQTHVKRCIIEMGGKNPVIVDTDADLDEAVDGVLYSAFGFSGQKCSAASRVIVLDDVYDKFVERFVEAAKSVDILPAENPKAYMGPVVDEEAHQRILNTIESASKSHKLLYKSPIPGGGYFVPITIFGDVDPNSALAQQEVFGPVVAVIRAKDLDHAIHIANSTEYALTGGVFSRSPANINKVKQELECGNLYVNRGITGAMVDRHPFGGFKMSGVGSKTGGPDYLKQFIEPVCITENTMRRGFAPAE